MSEIFQHSFLPICFLQGNLGLEWAASLCAEVVHEKMAAQVQFPRCGVEGGDGVASGAGQSDVDGPGVLRRLNLRPQGDSGAAVNQKLAATVLTPSTGKITASALDTGVAHD